MAPAAIIATVDELVTLLRQIDAREVAGDAVEGFNPAHDLCRLPLNAAVAILRAGARPGLRNRDFTLEALPAHGPEDMRGRSATGWGIAALVGEVPFYELHGQKRVEQGIYREALRFREHIEPLARGLMRHVEARTGSRAACR
jgi:hypothetical protein